MMTHGDLQFPNDAPLGSTDDPRGSDDDPMGPTNDPLNRPRESEYFYSLSELNSGVDLYGRSCLSTKKLVEERTESRIAGSFPPSALPSASPRWEGAIRAIAVPRRRASLWLPVLGRVSCGRKRLLEAGQEGGIEAGPGVAGRHWRGPASLGPAYHDASNACLSSRIYGASFTWDLRRMLGALTPSSPGRRSLLEPHTEPSTWIPSPASVS